MRAVRNRRFSLQLLLFLAMTFLVELSAFAPPKAHAQGSSVCVKNDEHCPAIEAQVNALFELAQEVLKTKVIPPVEEIEARLGVKGERYRESNGYEFRPNNSPHVLFYGSRNTTVLGSGNTRITFGFSTNKDHACVRMADLKSRLPGGKDEVRSHGFKGERVQPIASVQYMVDGDPQLYMSFSYWYQPCLGSVLVSASKRGKE